MTPSSDAAGTAVYRQIESAIRRQIEDGLWTVGSMLPSRRDLAKTYGVSTVTVERAIDGLIREGILRADDRRGTFVAAPIRSAEVEAPTASTEMVGIVASLYGHRRDHLELNDQWIDLVVRSIEHEFSVQGDPTMFFNRVAEDGVIRPLAESVEEAFAAGVHGLIVVAFGQEPDEIEQSVAPALGRGIPVVCITSGELKRPIPHAFLDNYDAGYQAAQHLLRAGCKEILYLSPFDAHWTREREEGVITAVLHDSNSRASAVALPRDRTRWVNESDPETLGYEAASKILKSGKLPDGVICANDGIAHGLLCAAEEAGLRVGTDFLLVGFDDHPSSRNLQLTTLRPAMEALGQESARLLRLALENRNHSLHIRLRWHLIPRASSRRAPDLSTAERTA